MAADNSLKSREVSAMIKQGFISDQTMSFSPSRSISRLYSPLSSPYKTLSSSSFSPPPQPPSQSAFSPSPANSHAHNQTLYEMMSEEQHREFRLSDDKRRKLHERVEKLLDDAQLRTASSSSSGDVSLTVVARDGFRVTMDVHKSVLSSKSRFFAEKLRLERGISHSVEISDCDDVEVYVETVVLMYSDDLKKRLIGEEVSKVLGLLKVCVFCQPCVWLSRKLEM